MLYSPCHYLLISLEGGNNNIKGKFEFRSMPIFYDHAVSFRKPKVTKRRRSENTSRLCSPPFDEESEPVGGPLSGGEPSALRIPSAAPAPPAAPASNAGRFTRLPEGLVRLISCCEDGGSMSSDDKKEVCSSSVLVLVIVTKESRRSFCAARGVPFRSST